MTGVLIITLDHPVGLGRKDRSSSVVEFVGRVHVEECYIIIINDLMKLLIFKVYLQLFIIVFSAFYIRIVSSLNYNIYSNRKRVVYL